MHDLTGAFRHYSWGSLDVIPGLLGIPATGEPFAEYWLGAHESAQAAVAGRPLQELLDADPSILSDHNRNRFEGRLPYLMKVVSAAGPMSLQAHPQAAQAASGFRRENDAGVSESDPTRIYRDPRPKDELIIATSDFHALCGFRDPQQTYRLFDQLPMKSSLDHLIGPLVHRGGAAGLAEVFLATLTYDDPRHALMQEVVAAAFERTEATGELGEFARTAVELDRFFPGQPAILAALLLNGVRLKPGEALFIPAGTMHSLLHGSAIEVSSCSDNVIRGGMTTKFINVDELIGAVDFTSAPPELGTSTPTADGVSEYVTAASDFRAWRLSTSGAGITVPGEGAPRVLITLDGEIGAWDAASHSVGTTTSTNGRVLGRGSAVLIGADERVTLLGKGTAYLAAARTQDSGI